MLSPSHGDVFYPSEKRILGKKGREKNETRNSGIQMWPVLYMQYRGTSCETNAKGCIGSTWRPPYLLRGVSLQCRQKAGPAMPQARNETGFGHKWRWRLEDAKPRHLVPSTRGRCQPLLTRGTSPSSLQQPTSYVLDWYHPSKHVVAWCSRVEIHSINIQQITFSSVRLSK